MDAAACLGAVAVLLKLAEATTSSDTLGWDCTQVQTVFSVRGDEV